jgi:intracellular multiplication protein IcmP
MSDKTNETQTLIAIGIILIIIAFLWYVYESQIAWVVGQTRLAYLWVFHFFTDHFERIRLWLLGVPLQANLPDSKQLRWEDIVIISALIGNYMRWPVALLFCYYIYWAIEKSPRRRFRTKFNMETLMSNQSLVWPIIRPIINMNPLKISNRIPGDAVPAELPLFAESLSPEEWVAWNRLPLRDGMPDKEALRQAFARQLGPKWEGMKGLRDHHRALIAAFSLNGAQRRDECRDLLGKISTCWQQNSGLRLTAEVRKTIDGILADKKLMEPTLKIASNYAYRTTALLALLRWAREQGGVLAPAQFLWLRGEDRALWYPLNNLGRRSYHAEASGAMAHYMAEVNAGRALPMPRVDNAIPAIIEYLQHHHSTIPPVAAATGGAVRDTAQLKIS